MARSQPLLRLPGLRLPGLGSPRIRRLVAIARRGVNLFPFTPLGLVTVAAAALALARYGIARADLLYLVIGAVESPTPVLVSKNDNASRPGSGGRPCLQL